MEIWCQNGRINALEQTIASTSSSRANKSKRRLQTPPNVTDSVVEIKPRLRKVEKKLRKVHYLYTPQAAV